MAISIIWNLVGLISSLMEQALFCFRLFDTVKFKKDAFLNICESHFKWYILVPLVFAFLSDLRPFQN